MALRMRHWVGLVMAGMALVAVRQLPPESFGRANDQIPSGVRARHAELNDDFRWTAEALRRHRWADSLSALAVETAERGVAVALPPSDLVDENLAARHAAIVRAEVSALPQRASEMVFGYFHQPFSHARSAEMPYSGRRRTETYVGTRDGVDYCLQVRVRGPNEISAVLDEVEGMSKMPPVTDRMGPCRFYLQYGMAGPGIEHWLQEGAVGFALETGEIPAELEAWSREVRLYRVFGFNVLASGNRSIEVDRCRAGIAEACGSLLLRPAMANPRAARDLEIARRSPALSIGGTALIGSIVNDAGYLLADLEADFGPEAFEAFWTSPDDVASAFEAAFGMTVGDWMVGWVDGVDGVHPATPALSRSASSGSMLFVALLVGLAFTRNRRRRLS